MGDDDLSVSLHDTFEEAPCGYLFTRPDGTFIRVNKTFLDWTGYSRQDLLSGKRFQDLLTFSGKIFYENQYFPLLRLQGFVHEIAFDIVGKDRGTLPVLMNSVQKPQDASEPGMVVSALLLATDRRSYEQELLLARQEAEQLSAVVTMSADAIVRCSTAGVVEMWNTGAERMFGFTEPEIKEARLSDLVPSIDEEEWSRTMRALQSGEAVYKEAIGRRADGSTIDVSVGLAPHFGPLGSLTALSAIIRDISESKAIQRLQNEFLAMTSHELRTPLTSIRGHAQLMLRRGVYERSHLDTIMASADQLGRLIEDLLLASRLEADRFDLRETDIDLAVVVQGAVDQVAGASGRTIHLEMPAHPLPVRGDHLRLGQVFANLLSNAVKYSSDDTDITVHVAPSLSDVLVSIIDRGVGISAEDLPHLFDRFYRVASTAGSVQGAGLGLYIADRLVRAHGGRIRVESEVQRGSVFTVSIPLREDTAAVSSGRSLAHVFTHQA